jgi:hypothetical protein
MKHPYRALLAGTALLILVLLALVGGYAFVSMRSEVAEAPVGPSSPAFPSAPGTGFSEGPESIALESASGGTLAVRDFTRDGVTVEDPANPGTFYLAGGSGYCDEDGQCPTGFEARNFVITYFEADDSFVVALTEEPLGRARLDAERYLAGALGIPTGSLCSLRHYVSTDAYTSEQYAGTDLGFTSCEDAVALP